MTARKRTAAKRVAHHPAERMTEAWNLHPKVTIASIVAALTIITSIAPALIWGVHYFATHEELAQHQRHDESKDAWASLQALRQETLVHRNRVNDCDVAKEQHKTMSPLERQACAQYASDLVDATKRFEEARTAAMATTKEQK